MLSLRLLAEAAKWVRDCRFSGCSGPERNRHSVLDRDGSGNDNYRVCGHQKHSDRHHSVGELDVVQVRQQITMETGGDWISLLLGRA